ncbi:hypothetical protein ALC60_04936 [Trachymyrmex zeteki]|uniref:Uncharacterized protein n=1 Tax=Mycetomoellerius zeteki TaxID=64791 RepID=A0A151X773_9HYME|nr:hypothetical protein ALC60_04936 [Trachymyrmex zeteki]
MTSESAPHGLCNKGADKGGYRQRIYRYTDTCIHNALSGRASRACGNLEEASNIPRLTKLPLLPNPLFHFRDIASSQKKKEEERRE